MEAVKDGLETLLRTTTTTTATTTTTTTTTTTFLLSFQKLRRHGPNFANAFGLATLERDKKKKKPKKMSLKVTIRSIVNKSLCRTRETSHSFSSRRP